MDPSVAMRLYGSGNRVAVKLRPYFPVAAPVLLRGLTAGAGSAEAGGAAAGCGVFPVSFDSITLRKHAFFASSTRSK
jgi:hypothetical protein